MLFYCPNCRSEVDVAPQSTITTQMNRIAYKALCPTCGQDMAEFAPIPQVNSHPQSPSIPTPTSEPLAPPPSNPHSVASPDPTTVNPAIAEATVTAFLSSDPVIPSDTSTSPATDSTLTSAQDELNKAAQSVEPTPPSISPSPDSLTEFSLNPST